MWTESATWGEIGYALLRLPVSAVALTISVVAWAVGLVLVFVPAYARSLPSGGPMIGDTVLHTRAELTLSAVIGAAVLLAAPQLTRGLAIADTALSRLLLGPRRDSAVSAMASPRVSCGAASSTTTPTRADRVSSALVCRTVSPMVGPPLGRDQP